MLPWQLYSYVSRMNLSLRYISVASIHLLILVCRNMAFRFINIKLQHNAGSNRKKSCICAEQCAEVENVNIQLYQERSVRIRELP